MQFGHFEIFVKNPTASKNFYQNILGFELVAEQGGQFVWLKSGETLILLRPGNNNVQFDNYQSANSAMVFYTADLNKAMEELEAKGLVFKGTDGSDNCPTFTDPDGNWFQLVNPEDH